MLKAWQVDRYDEAESCIVFAETQGKARQLGMYELEESFMDVQSPRRVKWADKFAEQGKVPLAEKIAHGWWQECAHCDAQVDEDSLADGARIVGEKAYCHECAKMLGGAE